MFRRCCRGRVGQVVGGNVDSLHRGDGTLAGGGDALLQSAHLSGQGGGIELGIAEHPDPLVALANDDLGQVGQLVARCV